jgi:hypothetical protein
MTVERKWGEMRINPPEKMKMMKGSRFLISSLKQIQGTA